MDLFTRTHLIRALAVIAAVTVAIMAIAAVGGHGLVALVPFFFLGTILEIPEMDTLRSVEDLTSFQKEVRNRIKELDAEKNGLPFAEAERDEWTKLSEADGEISKRVKELEARKKKIEDLAGEERNVERETKADEQIYRDPEAKGTSKERDIYDLSTIRVDYANPDRARGQLHDRAKRAIELANFPLTRDRGDVRTYGFSTEQARAHVEGLLEKDNERGDFGRYILATGDPAYRRAWTKAMNAAQRGVSFTVFTPDEQRAMQSAMAAERALSLGSTGIPIPYQLDPTIVPTSNSVVNPWRAICRTEQIVVNEWRGVTSGAVTAQYRAEGTEATDNAPTLAQPVIDAQRADAFIPFSIESGQDWNQLQSEMARLIADGKDDLESNKFFSGSGTNEPFGLNAMSVGIDVASAGVGLFAIADLYALEQAVPPRFRPRAQVAANKAIYNKARQFDTAGGSGVWFRNTGLQQLLENNPSTGGRTGNTGAEIIGYPAYESSQMLGVVATGNRILLMGNFQYYLIADRVGMSIELIPQLFGAASRFPTGQRGLFAFWRNGGKALSEAAFKALKVA